MKKWVTFSLIASVAIVLGIVGYNFLGKDATKTDKLINLTPTVTATKLTVDEVARHNIETDCWILIGENVYNVTEWLPKHPGGIDKILKYCGKDASAGFASKDSEPAKIHSETAIELRKSYLLGPLNGTPIEVKGKEVKIMDGLTIEDLVVGTGTEAVSGKMITVNYKGTLTNGTQFDSSYDRGQPFSFNLGAGEVIKGWDLGFAGMKVGGKRKLTIAPELGYGARDLGTIPSNSTLIFEVELLKVE